MVEENDLEDEGDGQETNLIGFVIFINLNIVGYISLVLKIFTNFN